MKLVPRGYSRPSPKHKWRWIILPDMAVSHDRDAWMTTNEVNNYRNWCNPPGWNRLHDGERVRVYTNGTITYCFIHVDVIE